MLTVNDIKLVKSYRDYDYRQPVYLTTLELRITGGYNPVNVTLSEEQTGRIVDHILSIASEGMAMELEKPEPVVEAPEPPAVAEPPALIVLDAGSLDEVAL